MIHLKFDIFHIAVDDSATCYNGWKEQIASSFGQLLGDRLKVSTINKLATTIEECITESIQSTTVESSTPTQVNENGEISW